MLDRCCRIELTIAFACWISVGLAAPAAEPIALNRDIRQILADNCYACHGPDRNQRKGNLRLDTEVNADEDRDRRWIVVPGKPEASELYRKLTTADPKKRMPPPKFGKAPAPQQVELSRRWLEQGGRWERHWSRLAPARPTLPRVNDGAWPLTPTDRFILARLEREGLKPSPAADRRTLLCRLALDLTGLPPSPKEVEALAADKAGDAYETLVDRLLASEHFGERMALYWLDPVRFADTGGAQPKEYTAKYAADRVRNASSVWLGLTLGCTACDDHKYDPLLTRDFYRFAAFFADVQEVAVGRQPQVPVPDDQRDVELKRLDEPLAAFNKTLQITSPEIAKGPMAWEQKLRARLESAGGVWAVVKPDKIVSKGSANLQVRDDLSVLASGRNAAKDV